MLSKDTDSEVSAAREEQWEQHLKEICAWRGNKKVFSARFTVTACVMSTQLGCVAAPRGQVCAFICVCIYCCSAQLWGNGAHPEPLTRDDQEDVYLILNAAHLVLQMVPTVPLSSGRNRDLNCFIRFLFVPAPLLSRLINLHHYRLSPAA